jgi:hypothetical protein
LTIRAGSTGSAVVASRRQSDGFKLIGVLGSIRLPARRINQVVTDPLHDFAQASSVALTVCGSSGWACATGIRVRRS